MVGTEHSIVGQVYAAKTDPEAADALIGQYMGFIRSETVKFIHAAPEDGHEDELSIAMLAFYEAVLSYEKHRGAFLPYAARAIKNRLIDHYRTERRHGNVISLHAPAGGDEESGHLLDALPDHRDEIGGRSRSSAPSWPGSGSPSPMWRTTAHARTGRWPPAAGCWTTPGRTRSC